MRTSRERLGSHGRRRRLWRPLLALLSLGAGLAMAQEPPISTQGTRILEGQGGFQIKVLLEASNLGDTDVEVAEIFFPAGTKGSAHLHGSHELLYVLSGQLEHVVDGKAVILGPGDLGIVRIGERVEHSVVSEEPVRLLAIWAPGGEAERLSEFFQERPVE